MRAAGRWTEEDFEGLSWHDCPIWGLAVRVGDPASGDWTSELTLDLDYITEWLCATDGGASFRVAPATLTFHEVTDPEVRVTWGDLGVPAAVHPMSIAGVTRTLVPGKVGARNQPYYRWTLALNWPKGGTIALGASGFTQVLRAEPVLTREQQLPAAARGKDVWS